MDSDLIHLISKDANALIKYILSHSKSPKALSTEIKDSQTKLHYSPTIIQEQQKELNQINHEGGLFTQHSPWWIRRQPLSLSLSLSFFFEFQLINPSFQQQTSASWPQLWLSPVSKSHGLSPSILPMIPIPKPQLYGKNILDPTIIDDCCCLNCCMNISISFLWPKLLAEAALTSFL